MILDSILENETKASAAGGITHKQRITTYNATEECHTTRYAGGDGTRYSGSGNYLSYDSCIVTCGPRHHHSWDLQRR